MSSRLPILTWLLTMFVAGCCGSRVAGLPQTPEIRFLPQETRPCLTFPPPSRPEVPTDDDDVAVARLLDYLDKLDRWAVYAWRICQKP